MLQASIDWLDSQHQITDQLGEVKKVTVKESIFYQGDSKQNPYNRYTLFVFGELRNAVVVLRASKSDAGKVNVVLKKFEVAPET